MNCQSYRSASIVLAALVVGTAVLSARESRPPALPDSSSEESDVRGLVTELGRLVRRAGTVRGCPESLAAIN
jgi:hypothetical protein